MSLFEIQTTVHWELLYLIFDGYFLEICKNKTKPIVTKVLTTGNDCQLGSPWRSIREFATFMEGHRLNYEVNERVGGTWEAGDCYLLV